MLAVLDQALYKYHTSKIVPGEAVGAVGAQSLSEPGTQVGGLSNPYLIPI